MLSAGGTGNVKAKLQHWCNIIKAEIFYRLCGNCNHYGKLISKYKENMKLYQVDDIKCQGKMV